MKVRILFDDERPDKIVSDVTAVTILGGKLLLSQSGKGRPFLGVKGIHVELSYTEKQLRDHIDLLQPKAPPLSAVLEFLLLMVIIALDSIAFVPWAGMFLN